MEAFARETEELPNRVEGWLQILDVGTSSDYSLLVDLKLQKNWIRQYCILHVMNHCFSQYLNETDSETRKNKSEMRVLKLDALSLEENRSSAENQKERTAKEQWNQATKVMSSSFVCGSTGKSKKVASPKDSGYEKPLLLKERRGSVPTIAQCIPVDDSDEPSASNRLMSYISRKSSEWKSNLKRAKSATKLERDKPDVVAANKDHGNESFSRQSVTSSLKRTLSLNRLSRRFHGKPRPGHDRLDVSGDSSDRPNDEKSELRGTGGRGGGGGGGGRKELWSASSHESLPSLPSNVHSLDLSTPNVHVKPLHGSVLGREHCFQVSTANATKFYASRTAEERQAWMQHLQKTIEPFQDQIRRTELSLNLWIFDARNLPTKQRYYCEVHLDNTLYGRTSAKLNSGSSLFWGEQFAFSNLPTFKSLKIKLFKEVDRRRKKDSNIFLGHVEVPVSSTNTRQLMESWYSLSSSVLGRLKKDAGLRVKAKYQRVEILPINFYQPLIEYIRVEYRPLVNRLELELKNVREKDELAASLVTILHKTDSAREFLVHVIVDDIKRQGNQRIFLRSNSIATKAIDAYMKLVGEKYLKDTLGDFVKMVLESELSFEVDPLVVMNAAELRRNQEHLINYCHTVWFKIVNSHAAMPLDLKRVFSALKEHLNDFEDDDDIVRQLVGSCIFLRFFCAAILSPSMFGLAQVFPQDRHARNLTLIAKVIQGLANFASFGGGKEDFMVFMNSFVETETPNMKIFLDQISTVDEKNAIFVPNNNYVDLGREISILHSLLIESSGYLNDKNEEASGNDTDRLNRILSDVSDALRSFAAETKAAEISKADQTDGPLGSSSPFLLAPNRSFSNNNDDAESETSSPRFVSNTSFVLTSSTSSLPSDAAPSSLPSDAAPSPFGAVLPPRSRNTMREMMQDSDRYTSLTSPKELPVCAPVTSASVLFGAGGSATATAPNGHGAEDATARNRVMFAAETIDSDCSLDLESIINGMSDSLIEFGEDSAFARRSASSSLCSLQGTGASYMTATAGRQNHQQPLAFANPLFAYAGPKPPVSSSSSIHSLQNENDKKNPVAVWTDPKPFVVGGAACPPAGPPPRILSPGQPPSKGSFLYGSCSNDSLPRRKNGGPVGFPAESRHHQLPTRNSASLAVSDVEAYFAMATGKTLSHSMEFPATQQQQFGADGGLLKRNNTDSMIVLPRGNGVVGLNTPPKSPTCGSGLAGGARGRNGPPANTVRMGVRSMQRKLQENEKGKHEYELELRNLHQQLADTRRRLEQEKAATVAQVHAEWRQKLRTLEEQHRQNEADKDETISNLKQRLSTTEQERHKDQILLLDNQKTIQELKQKVQTLTSSLNDEKMQRMSDVEVPGGRQCSTH